MKQLHIGNKGGQRITERSGAVNALLKDVSSWEKLTADDEAECSKIIRDPQNSKFVVTSLTTKSGEKGYREPQNELASDAVEKLVKGNAGFVVSVAKQYQGMSLSLAELINSGNLGAINAAKRYDGSTGFKFISYAIRHIRAHILKDLAEMQGVSASIINDFGKIRKAQNSLTLNTTHVADTHTLSELTDLTTERIDQVLQRMQYTISFDEPIGEDGSLYDMVPSQDIVNNNEEQRGLSIDMEYVFDEVFGSEQEKKSRDTSEGTALRRSKNKSRTLGQNKKRQRIILEMYAEGIQVQDIAEELGMSDTTVRNEYERGLRKIRRWLNNNTENEEVLRKYLG